jgi:hypothetical protein
VKTLILALLLVATAARADEDTIEQVHMRFVEGTDTLTVETKLNKLFDSTAYEALDSGFPSTVIIKMYVIPQGSTSVVAYTELVRSCVYDLWDEDYTIQLAETDFDKKTNISKVKVKKHAAALQTLTDIDAVPIAALDDLPIGQVYTLDVEAILNPVSKETQAEVRRWLSQGTGGGLDRGGTFFGSFVSVFVNSKIPDADRVLRLRSQPFYRPKS